MPRVWFLRAAQIFLFSTTSKPNLGLNQPHLWCIRRVMSRDSKQPGCANLFPSSAAVKNGWIYTSDIPYVSMLWRLVNLLIISGLMFNCLLDWVYCHAVTSSLLEMHLNAPAACCVLESIQYVAINIKVSQHNYIYYLPQQHYLDFSLHYLKYVLLLSQNAYSNGREVWGLSLKPLDIRDRGFESRWEHGCS